MRRNVISFPVPFTFTGYSASSKSRAGGLVVFPVSFNPLPETCPRSAAAAGYVVDCVMAERNTLLGNIVSRAELRPRRASLDEFAREVREPGKFSCPTKGSRGSCRRGLPTILFCQARRPPPEREKFARVYHIFGEKRIVGITCYGKFDDSSLDWSGNRS